MGALAQTASMQTEHDADRRRKLLLDMLQEMGWTAHEWAARAEIAPNTLYNFIKGRSNSLSLPIIERLAASAGVEVSRLTGNEPLPIVKTPLVYVRGEAEGSVFREAAQWPEHEWQGYNIPVQEQFKDKASALVVKGPSMNLVYPEDTIITVIPLKDSPRALHTGDRVVVQRISADGLYETTVKELVFDAAGQPWLWPRSDHPKYQSPVEIAPELLRAEGARVDGEIRITAVVIGSYRPEFA